MTTQPLRQRDRVTGRTYLERGEPVLVVARWGAGGGPRNVLVRRGDGTHVVRPFRGLRREPPPYGQPTACPESG